ncbi:MAG: hypothetical protein WCB57_01595 [Pseudonocardiaceae bacterium]
MLAGVDHAPSLEADEDQYDGAPKDDTDPSALAPLCGEVEFTELVDEMVADEAPRLFAVVQEYGERVDGRIAAWGMAFEDRTEIVSVDHRMYLNLSSPQRAACLLSHRPHVTARLVWVNPDKASPPDEIDAA